MRVWESSMHTKVPEFQGSLQPEEFIEWLCTAEEVIEFKGVHKEMKVPLVAKGFGVEQQHGGNSLN